jgi:hypothetical protein
MAAVQGKMSGSPVPPSLLGGTQIIEWNPEARAHLWANSTA